MHVRTSLLWWCFFFLITSFSALTPFHSLLYGLSGWSVKDAPAEPYVSLNVLCRSCIWLITLFHCSEIQHQNNKVNVLPYWSNAVSWCFGNLIDIWIFWDLIYFVGQMKTLTKKKKKLNCGKLKIVKP